MHDLWILLALMAAIATAAGTVFLKLADKTKYHNNMILAFTFLSSTFFSMAGRVTPPGFLTAIPSASVSPPQTISCPATASFIDG